MRHVGARVPLAECFRRAAEHCELEGQDCLPASDYASVIWPEATWRSAQSAGAAASRVLKAMERSGRAR